MLSTWWWKIWILIWIQLMWTVHCVFCGSTVRSPVLRSPRHGGTPRRQLITPIPGNLFLVWTGMSYSILLFYSILFLELIIHFSVLCNVLKLIPEGNYITRRHKLSPAPAISYPEMNVWPYTHIHMLQISCCWYLIHTHTIPLILKPLLLYTTITF